MSNGEINIRKTHPALYRCEMTLAFGAIALGLNFIQWRAPPTFLIWDMPNALWGSIFLALGFAQLIVLNVPGRLKLVRALMAISMGYMMFLAVGACTPFKEGTGSLQLPILYALVSALRIPLLLEPFINPVTAVKE